MKLEPEMDSGAEEDEQPVDEEEADGEQEEEEDTGAKKSKKKRALKKAPGAPKRGKSAYIFFSMAMRPKVKEGLPSDAKVTEVMKVIAEMWRSLDAESKKHWEEQASADKQRYEEELAKYDGPLKVANKRVKKDPKAPKRAMSAFLHFSKAQRAKIKVQYPDAKNVDVSKMLGEEWGKLTAEDKQPFQELAAEEGERYKEAMAAYSRGEYVAPGAAAEEAGEGEAAAAEVDEA